MESNVYHGVNLVYYGTQGQLEYDFDVAPGVDPSVIRLVFQGAGDVRIDEHGELMVKTPSGEVRLLKPIAYQEIGGSKHSVAVSYVLKDKNSVAFQMAEYDSRRPLVIDPILSYSTYLGGSNIDTANAIAVAPDNTAFVAGSTFSSDFPTIHALQPNEGGGPDFPLDAFVAKISADGSTLLYSTYLGGENQDAANGIAVDSFGNAFVTGYTLSTHFPVTSGSFGTVCGGDGKCGASFNSGGLIVSNAFVTKLNAAGSAIIYSGYLGEYENVKGQAIAVDLNGNVWVTGETEANLAPTVTITPPNVGPPPFPITSTAFQTNFGGGSWDAFLTKIDPTGSTIEYSSYLGGNDEDIAYGIAVDDSSNIFITGLTYSTNFPTTDAPLQGASGGAGDAFVTKVNVSSSETASVVYSTYLGGAGLDQGNSIATDQQGNAYVTGLTNSAVFGFTPAGFQPVYNGEGDAFVAKLNPTGALSYFTYLGGTKADQGTGIAVDTGGNAYVTGTTVSTNFPIAGAVFQPTYGGGDADSFVAKLDPTGTTLVYSSYLGGTNTELATGIAIDTSGAAYVTGQTCSQDFPLANPLQAVPGGNCDAYIAKVSALSGIALYPAGLVFAPEVLNTPSASQTVTLTNGDSQQTITNISISGTNAGDFFETNTCPTQPSPLAVGATCTFTVTFTPKAIGIRQASLEITDSSIGGFYVVNLTGSTPTITLSPSALSFGNQQVGTPSSPLPIVVTNSGTTPITISSITASGDFSETDNCIKAALQPNTNCVVQVTFTPSDAVSTMGAVTFTDNGLGSPQIIIATGTGVLEPQASVAPASLGFTSQPIGASSTPQQVILSNTGNAALNISSIVASGDFTQASTCGSILSAKATCSISVTFTPSAAGTRSGTLTVTDNTASVPGSTQTVPLSGIGQAVPVVSLSTNTLTFSGQTIASPSAAQAVTLTNTGSAALNISNVTSSGDFAQVNNCSTSVAAGGNCTINVTFTPTVSGNRFGSVTITDNTVSGSQTISMSGTGTGANFQISASTQTATVSAGQQATYTLNISSVGADTQPVTLGCSGAPTANISCSVSPGTVTPSATTTAALTVSTGLRTLAPPSSRIKVGPFGRLPHSGVTWIAWLMVVLMIISVAAVRRRPITAGFGFVVVLLLVSVACGAGSGSGTSSSSAGTPAGTYHITVTGTSGSVSSSMQVTLLVN